MMNKLNQLSDSDKGIKYIFHHHKWAQANPIKGLPWTSTRGKEKSSLMYDSEYYGPLQLQ